MTHAARLTVALALTFAAGGAAAEDYSADNDFWGNDYAWGDAGTSAEWSSQSIRLKAGIGILALQSNETVYSGNYRVSKLIWTSMTPVLRGSISADVGHGFSVSAEGSAAGFGASSMEDYDWLAGDDTFDNWTDRSQHPDTRLAHFFTGAVSLGYDVVQAPDARVRLSAGLKYTDVKWNAYGGSFIYSVGGFRDTTGNFPAGTLVGSYQQQFPEVFVGAEGDQYFGDRLRLGALLRGGLTVKAQGTDDHWLRGLRFVDNLNFAPTLTAGLDLGYRLSDFAEAVIAARYEQVFEARGTTDTYDQLTGALLSSTPDTGAGDMRSLEFTAGVRGSF